MIGSERKRTAELDERRCRPVLLEELSVSPGYAIDLRPWKVHDFNANHQSPITNLIKGCSLVCDEKTKGKGVL